MDPQEIERLEKRATWEGTMISTVGEQAQRLKRMEDKMDEMYEKMGEMALLLSEQKGARAMQSSIIAFATSLFFVGLQWAIKR